MAGSLTIHVYMSVLFYESTSNKIIHHLELIVGPERFNRDARTMHAKKNERTNKNRVELGGLSSTLEMCCHS